MDIQHHKIAFLDIVVKRDINGYITTDINHKETDTKQYLDCRSCHPRHIKNNVLFNWLGGSVL